jgi:HKD family nuclease
MIKDVIKHSVDSFDRCLFASHYAVRGADRLLCVRANRVTLFPNRKGNQRKMANLSFILQAARPETHTESLLSLFEIPNPQRVLISVAFARTAGIEILEESLKIIASKTRFFVGIRNDITSVQAVKKLLSLGAEVYAVDTGSRHIIFHPKLYIAVSDKAADAVIGSANLTFNGLNNNIEVSTRIQMNTKDPEDEKFISEVFDSFDVMLKTYPDHVFMFKDEVHVDEIFKAGRLADESIVKAPSTSSSVKVGERDYLAPMKLAFQVPPKPTPKPPHKKVAANPSLATVAPTTGGSATISPWALVGTKYLVWKSKPLSERDLNIPTGENTNATGSMGLKKGLYDDIDHRHYFYDEVFTGLSWTADTGKSMIVRSTAKFELIVANINYGTFALPLSHNKSTTSATYKQNNFMTNLHWDAARKHIAKQDLLGRTLLLYRKDGTPARIYD